MASVGLLAAGVLFASARHVRPLIGTEATHHRTEIAAIILAIALAIGILMREGKLERDTSSNKHIARVE